MERTPTPSGKVPVARPPVRPITAVPLAPRAGAPAPAPPAAAKPSKARVRGFVIIGLLSALLVVGSLNLALPRGPSPEALANDDYVFRVKSAISSLDIVFSQADETVKAFQAGWLAPEGAAREFEFLQDHIKGVKDEVSEASPPPRMETFHRNLGRTLSLTQQAMDAMQAGFSTGDGAYFDLAHEKLAEARASLSRAAEAL